MPLRTTKKLLCPACGAVVAEATYQRFPADLVLVGPDGARVQPEAAGVQERRARDRLEFLQRHFGELVRAVRGSPAQWVDVG